MRYAPLLPAVLVGAICTIGIWPNSDAPPESEDLAFSTLVVPSEIAEHSLVQVTPEVSGKFVDVMVMTAHQGDILLVDCVQTVNGFWVFTGPPGRYSIRCTAFDETNGFRSETGKLTIGTPKPDPKPDPKPNPKPEPEPPANDFAGQVRAAFALVPESSRSVQVTITQGDGHTVKMSAQEAIAANYSEIATEASDGGWSPADMVAEAKTRHTSALPNSVMVGWVKFWPELAKALRVLKLDSSDTAGHVAAFRTIAKEISDA